MSDKVCESTSKSTFNKRRSTPSSYFEDSLHTSNIETGNTNTNILVDDCIQDQEYNTVSKNGTSKNKVDCSTQVDFSKRKKWVRPPLIGQASSSNDDATNRVNCSDSNEFYYTTYEPFAYFNVNEFDDRQTCTNKPVDGSSGEHSVLNISDLSVRVPSPSTSTASVKRLEWDSGADVGYGLINNSDDLSSLEKIALTRTTATLFARSDPEGTTENKITRKNNIVPIANSTPLSSINPKHYPLFPEVLITNKKSQISTSLENLNKLKFLEPQASTFPRSHSQIDLNEVNPNIKRFLNSSKSHSSSSVSTVVKNRENRIVEIIRPAIPSPQESNSIESGNLTSEDRANSFEYLPGHIYENRNLQKNNLQRDIEHGVNLITEFAKNSKTDLSSQKELVKQVVEKLLQTNYSDDSNSAINNDAIDERSCSKFTTAVHKCVGTGKSSSLSGYTESPIHSETNYSRKNMSKNSKLSTQSGRKSHFSRRPFDTCQSESTDSKSSNHYSAPTSVTGDKEIIKYMNTERKNQLHWIKSEISHLSNLQQLLERHEILKGKFYKLKKGDKGSERPLKSLSSHLDSLSNIQKKQAKKKNESKLNNENNSSEYTSTLSKLSRDRSKKSEDSVEKSNCSTKHQNVNKKKHVSASSTAVSSIDNKEVLPSQKNKITQPIAYSIVVEDEKCSKIAPSTKEESNNTDEISEENVNTDNIMVSLGELHDLLDEILITREKIKNKKAVFETGNIKEPTLQDYLFLNRPDMVLRAETRREIISELVTLREKRQKKKRELLGKQNLNTDEISPPPLRIKRIFPPNEIRRRTREKIRNSQETKNQMAELKRKEAYKTNRLMAQVFKKKLQKRALKGNLDLSNSVSVICDM